MTAPHPIPAAAMKESIAFVGRTGSGKSYAAKGAVELLLTAGERVCIVDPTSVWYGLRKGANRSKPGFSVVIFGGSHADVQIADGSGAAVGELLATRNLPAIVDVSEFSRAGMVRFMGAFLDALYKGNRTPLTLVVDEADIFAPQRVEPDTATMLGRMEQIVRRGRVKGFRPWLITQRPASLNKNVLSQANTLIAMQLTAPQDRDAIGAWIEGQADRDEGKRVLAQLPKLKKGAGFVWSPSHGVLEEVTFPPIETFDSGRTPEGGEVLPPMTLSAIDLTGIAESLHAVEAEVANNDPKKLKARIAELERLNRLAVKPPTDEAAALADAQRREVAGYQRGRAEGMTAALEVLEPVAERIRTLRNELHEQLGGLLSDLARPRVEAKLGPPKTAPIIQRVIPTPARMPAAKQNVQNGSERTKQRDDLSGLGRPQQRILNSLAFWESIGHDAPSREQVAAVAGYAPKSGNFNNLIGGLRTSGFVEAPAPGHLSLIVTGRDYSIMSEEEARDMLRSILSAPQLRIVEAMQRKDVMSRQQVADGSGYVANSGNFNNLVGSLATIGILTRPSQGHLALATWAAELLA